MYVLDDTIVAIASPPGGAARGIVRLSGPDVATCLSCLFEPDPKRPFTSEKHAVAIAGTARLGSIAARLPTTLFFWPHGRSYTGQPTAEFHTLGSRPLLEALVRAACEAGARLAEPGEFTLRAFLRGRIDLTQAEAVLGVIDAQGPRQLDVALEQLAGGLAGPLGRLREQLLECLAHLEASFDFAEEDIEFIDPETLQTRLASAAHIVKELAARIHERSSGEELPEVVLLGWPNAGKSSLFNALCGRAGALVSHHPGTTRDYLTAELDLDGVRCRLVDTAGIETEPCGEDNDVCLAAQTATAEKEKHARVHILCLDGSRPPNTWERAEVDRGTECRRLVAWTKADLGRQHDFLPHALRTSSATGEGLVALAARVREAIRETGIEGEDMVPGTAARCRESLRMASACLRRALGLVETRAGEELVAAEVRGALDELGKVVGAVHTEDVLERVFSRFCVGK